MMASVGNHLWQSTLFLLAAALLTLAFRKHRAHVRHWIWLAASVKFLVPFAPLVSLGSRFSWRSPGTMVEIPLAFDVAQPFTPSAVGGIAGSTVDQPALAAVPAVLIAIWLAGFVVMTVAWSIRWRRVAAAARRAPVVEDGRVWEILRRLEGAGPHPKSRFSRLALVLSDTSMEPGVFGILRPVLLWPRAITDRLSDAQIEAVLAHELAHVRRHDNLAATVQMAVQAVFWFHPLVWWLGVRLIEERERACDEDVIRQGSEPHVYAQSILRTCELYVEAPLACVAGVTGADLKKRIEQIMRSEAGAALDGWRKALLAASAAAAIAGPLVIGVLSAPSLRAQAADIPATDATFEVVSIKPNKSGPGPGGFHFLPSGQFVATNFTLPMLISSAYGGPLQPLLPGQLAGGPDWIDSERFDVLAKAEAGLPQGPNSPLPQMLKNMLADRFKLVVRTEARERPIFALVMARSDGRIGRQITPAKIDCSAGRGRGAPPVPLKPGERPACGIRFLRGNISAGGVTMAQFANALSRIAGRIVVDRTGLSGGFDLDLQWTPDGPTPAVAPDPRFPQPPVDPDGPSLFTAVPEQLGLKLEAQEGLVDVHVIDHAERPTTDDFESIPIPGPPLPPPPPPPPPPPGL
jgi:uncharacterized protein (TIGR03435 family)